MLKLLHIITANSELRDRDTTVNRKYEVWWYFWPGKRFANSGVRMTILEFSEDFARR